MFTPADLLESAAVPDRPPLAVRTVVRAVFNLSMMIFGAWLAHRAAISLRQFCSGVSSFQGSCSGDPRTRDSVFAWAGWALVLGTVPGTGITLRRWWAWLLPLPVVGAYALLVGLPHLPG